MMRRVRAVILVVLAACAPLPPPRAVMRVFAQGDQGRDAVLVTPTRSCTAPQAELCSPETYRTGTTQNTGPMPTLADLIDPIVRLKLELAGYTLTDANTLRLTTVDRTDVTVQDDARGATMPSGQTTHVDDAPTVATLSADDQLTAARSLGLTGVLRSSVQVYHESQFAPVRLELTLEMMAIPERVVLWKVRCSEEVETFESTARLLANCVGDGVLAWRAPDAVIGRQP